MKFLLHTVLIAIAFEKYPSFVQANDFKDYIGLNINQDKAVIKFGKVKDVALARTGPGELTIKAKKIIVGDKKIDLLKALSSSGSSGGDSAGSCEPLRSKLLPVKSCKASSEYLSLIHI